MKTSVPAGAAGRSAMVRAAPAMIWGLVAAAVFFHLAQFIDAVSWNAVELIIGQKLREHGSFVESLDFPSAITLRPVLPVVLISLLERATDDPVVIFQCVCGAALGVFVASMFLSGRVLGGERTAHLAAILAFLCPAVTTYIIHHQVSYSHIVALGFFGPALWTSLRLLLPGEDAAGSPLWNYAAAGLLWGLAYLCRVEMQLFFAVFMAAVAWRSRKSGRLLQRFAAVAGFFALTFVPYNLYAGAAAERDGLLARKTIYGFYASQGWVEPAPNSGPDTEADGYVYATKLYGDPKAVGESVFRAVANNPRALLHRVRINLGRFYDLMANNAYVPAWLSALAALFVVTLAAGAVPPRERVAAFFLVGLFLAGHFLLLFHIDPRYPTIVVPVLILAAARGVSLTLGFVRRRLPPRTGWAVAVLLLGLLAWALRSPWQQMSAHPSGRPGGVAAMRALAAHFRSVVPAWDPVVHREPHIGLMLAANPPIRPEDGMLLAYFSHTGVPAHESNAFYPRARLFSFRDTREDFFYAPIGNEAKPTLQGTEFVAAVDDPILGRYGLFKVPPAN